MRTYQNLWDASGAALAGQLKQYLEGKLQLSMLILIEEGLSQTNDLRLHLKNQVKNYKESIRKERNEKQLSMRQQQKSVKLKLLNLQPE